MVQISIIPIILYLFTFCNTRSINSLWNLEEICYCRLGYGAFVYNDYGCWCGIGGSGKPMDGIDR